MGTRRLRGVEIFAQGTWNGREFTAEDLDGIEASFFTLGLGGRVPLKLGHEGDDPREGEESQLALGWVARVFREGDKLLADIDVTTDVAQLISDGRLRFVSVELLKDVKAGTRVIPWVLDAVALLGTDQPAVGILKGLDKHVAARAPASESFAHSARIHCTRIIETTEKDHDMTKETELAAEVKTLRAEIAKLVSDAKAREIKSHRAALVARIETAINAGEVQPNAREKFKRIHKLEDDKAVMDVTLEDADEFVAASRVPGWKRKDITSFSRDATHEAPGDAPGDEEFVKCVDAWLAERKIDSPKSEDYERAVLAIFKTRPDVANRYKREVLVKTGHAPK